MTTETRLIGYYKKKNSTDGVDITVQEFLDGVATGRWRKHVEWVRDALNDPKEYDRRKNESPCVTIGGTFNGAKTKDNLREPSGLMAIDLDFLADQTEAIQRRLSQDPFVFAVFKSIGGRGLCVIFRINPDRWDDSFAGLSDYLITEYGLVGKQFDPSSSNINRLRFVSYDPNIYVGEKTKLFTKYPRKEKKPKKTGIPEKWTGTESDIQHIIDQINARALDLTGSYYDWYRIGWALISEYGEAARDLFQQVSQYHPEYDADECDRKFRYLVATRPSQIKIATFYWYCKQAGLDIMTPRTQEIVSVATMAKKQKITQASAVDMVGKQLGVAAAEAAPIVEQVYASAEAIDTQETLFDQLELFLKTNYDLKFNEVTHYLEDAGIPLVSDRQLNDIYIHAAKTFDMKVHRDHVMTVLFSSAVPGYHPIKSFFAANRKRRPVGVIDALADTIKHDMTGGGKGPSNYVHFFLRKFLVGMISTVYGQQCPLVPILTGGKNVGKTQFWRRLLPAELMSYYAETKFQKETDDEMLMCKRLLLMNDDFDNEFLARHARFKSLTDKHTFTIRKPYGKAHEDMARLAVIAGTSNEDKLLSDPTGNRRIIPINVISIDHAAYNAIDKTDLIMEAWHAYDAGERPDLTNEQIEFLERHTGRFIDVSTEHDLVEKYFDVPTIKEDSMLWNQGEILEYLSRMSGMKNLKPKLISQEMKRMGFPYSDSEYYKTERRAKRGFWLYTRSMISQ